MSLRDGKWTSYPNDEQIRREANREYWKFVCPKCGVGATGQLNAGDKRWHLEPKDGKYIHPSINHVWCHMCGWDWKDPVHYEPKTPKQTLLLEFS